MIPNNIFMAMVYASNYNHGARLVKGGWTYQIGTRKGRVAADMKERTITKAEFDKLPADQCWEEINPYTHVATYYEFQKCALGDIPDSQESEWEVWDEY